MDYYLIIVFILFALAISDLIVGVANDAVNFLNSAIGSKVAPRYIIFIVASLGILAGALFSNGMMEVARNGIFQPHNFLFSEIMIIFMAVMFVDILLLDFFNTIGLPTSTTVSIVFELLGAAVAVALVKINTDPNALPLIEYINSAKALTIISGILISVIVAFTVGLIVQWISRLIFSFDYNKALKYFGSLWGGLAISGITYFILIKGIKGASFMSADTNQYIATHAGLIMGASFIFWTILMQLLNWIFKINVLKVIVLVGTFALAMAFAGNDLVNFIGVPLAGYESFKLSGGSQILMDGLNNKVQTPPVFLVIAGIIMVITLWMSKKARSVTETEINLSRQDEGMERFGSSKFSRLLVRKIVNGYGSAVKYVPAPILERVGKRFDQKVYIESQKKVQNPPMFDLVRASVNLTVASMLIAFATSLKLPLSTTYVTFMVAMGTSLADGAWGRDSAVYRITGVFTVIGGWFLTAFIAFTCAFLVALFINWLGVFAIVALIIISVIIVYRTTIKKHKTSNSVIEVDDDATTTEKVIEKCKKGVIDMLDNSMQAYKQTIEGLINDDRRVLRNIINDTDDMEERVKKIKSNIHKTITKINLNPVDTGQHYVQLVYKERDLVGCISQIVKPAYAHVDNNHKPINEKQALELTLLTKIIADFLDTVKKRVKINDYSNFDLVYEQQTEIVEKLQEIHKNQVRRIKNKEVGTKNSILYLNIIAESKNLIQHTVNILKSQRDFYNYSSMPK